MNEVRELVSWDGSKEGVKSFFDRGDWLFQNYPYLNIDLLKIVVLKLQELKLEFADSVEIQSWEHCKSLLISHLDIIYSSSYLLDKIIKSKKDDFENIVQHYVVLNTLYESFRRAITAEAEAAEAIDSIRFANRTAAEILLLWQLDVRAKIRKRGLDSFGKVFGWHEYFDSGTKMWLDPDDIEVLRVENDIALDRERKVQEPLLDRGVKDAVLPEKRVKKRQRRHLFRVNSRWNVASVRQTMVTNKGSAFFVSQHSVCLSQRRILNFLKRFQKKEDVCSQYICLALPGSLRPLRIRRCNKFPIQKPNQVGNYPATVYDVPFVSLSSFSVGILNPEKVNSASFTQDLFEIDGYLNHLFEQNGKSDDYCEQIDSNDDKKWNKTFDSIAKTRVIKKGDQCVVTRNGSHKKAQVKFVLERFGKGNGEEQFDILLSRCTIKKGNKQIAFDTFD